MKLYLDFETYNEEPITRGTYRYAETAEIMLATFAVDDGPVEVVDFTSEAGTRQRFFSALREAEKVVAHNAMFDRVVLRAQMPEVCPPSDRWECTMVQALSHGLPGGLDKLCEVFRLDEDKAKDKAGKQLIQLFCKPRPQKQHLRRATAQTNPVEWARFVEYARKDVTSMRELHKRIPKWNYRGEWLNQWHLDQRINDRGFCTDTVLVHGAILTVEKAIKENAAEVKDITLGAVSSATKRDALLAHILKGYGVTLPDLTSDTLKRRLEDEELPTAVRELIRLRLAASTSSTSKYKRLAFCTSSDSRMRGTIQWRGAARTGRHAGRNFQPQNLPRVSKAHKNMVKPAIEAMKNDGLDLLTGEVMSLASACLRGVVVAPHNRVLRVSDYSNIEGRMLAWLAGEEWKLAAFRNLDKDPGNKALDLYVIGYARAFGVPIKAVVADENAGGKMRLIGKVQELALGYQGSVGAYRSMAEVYHIDEVREEEALVLVRAWRKANPNIVKFWYDIERAAKAAVQNKGTTVRVRAIAFRCEGGWLRIRLPSGRYLCYFRPGVDNTGQLSYLGVDQYTRRWKRLNTYGGKLVENITQGAAADILGDGMLEAEDMGFDIVLHVHDEIIAETDRDSGLDEKVLAECMARERDWHKGLPLAAAGYSATRYRKG